MKNSREQNELPNGARCVFEGEIFDVWHWEQKMFDGTTETFEKLSRPDTVNVIATADDKILLQRQKQAGRQDEFLSVPGGRVDEGEEPLAAAKRELLEETGYTSQRWRLWKQIHPYGKIIWTVHTYIANDCVRASEPKLDAGEKITTRLVTFDEFLTLAEDPTFRDWDIKFDLLRARYDNDFRRELHRAIFGWMNAAAPRE